MRKVASLNGILVQQETQRLREKGDEIRQAVIPVALLVLMLVVILVLSKTRPPLIVSLWLRDVVVALILVGLCTLIFWAGWKLSNAPSIRKDEFLGRKMFGKAVMSLSLALTMGWLIYVFGPLVLETFRMLVQL